LNLDLTINSKLDTTGTIHKIDQLDIKVLQQIQINKTKTTAGNKDLVK